MTSPLQRKRKGTRGRKVDPTIAAGTRRARGRLVAPVSAFETRADQLAAACTVQDIEPGDRLQAFADGEDVSAGRWATAALLSDYQAFEAQNGKRSAFVRNLPPFTDAEMAAIQAGTGPRTAPWPNLQPA